MDRFNILLLIHSLIISLMRMLPQITRSFLRQLFSIQSLHLIQRPLLHLSGKLLSQLNCRHLRRIIHGIQFPSPSDIHPIGCRYVFKLKLNADVTIDKYKARLVAKGYTQQLAWIIMRPLVQLPNSLLSEFLWVQHLCMICHLIIQMFTIYAFLNGELTEIIYMFPPPDYLLKGENKVCKLNKSLYGLKQASMQ